MAFLGDAHSALHDHEMAKQKFYVKCNTYLRDGNRTNTLPLLSGEKQAVALGYIVEKGVILIYSIRNFKENNLPCDMICDVRFFTQHAARIYYWRKYQPIFIFLNIFLISHLTKLMADVEGQDRWRN